MTHFSIASFDKYVLKCSQQKDAVESEVEFISTIL